MSDNDRRSLRLTLLHMKRRTGQLTDEERQELRSTLIFIGGEEPNTRPLVVPPQAETAEEWVEPRRELPRADTDDGIQ